MGIGLHKRTVAEEGTLVEADRGYAMARHMVVVAVEGNLGVDNPVVVEGNLAAVRGNGLHNYAGEDSLAEADTEDIDPAVAADNLLLYEFRTCGSLNWSFLTYAEDIAGSLLAEDRMTFCEMYGTDRNNAYNPRTANNLRRA